MIYKVFIKKQNVARRETTRAPGHRCQLRNEVASLLALVEENRPRYNIEYRTLV